MSGYDFEWGLVVVVVARVIERASERASERVNAVGRGHLVVGEEKNKISLRCHREERRGGRKGGGRGRG